MVCRPFEPFIKVIAYCLLYEPLGSAVPLKSVLASATSVCGTKTVTLSHVPFVLAYYTGWLKVYSRHEKPVGGSKSSPSKPRGLLCKAAQLMGS